MFQNFFKNKKFNFADPESRGQAKRGREMEREDEALPAEMWGADLDSGNSAPAFASAGVTS